MARLTFVKRAKLLGLTLEEIEELVSLAADCNDGQIVPSLVDILEVQLEKTERNMKELATFRESLLYYKRRLFEDDPGRACSAETSFCGCLEAVGLRARGGGQGALSLGELQASPRRA